MKRWSVRVPITGFAVVEVEAETEAEAFDKALNVEGLTLEEWEATRHVSQGNVSYAMLNSIDAEDLGETK